MSKKTIKNKKRSHGGARLGAGAKKKSDIKKPVTVYVYESAIGAIGGMETAKQVAYEAIMSAKEEVSNPPAN